LIVIPEGERGYALINSRWRNAQGSPFVSRETMSTHFRIRCGFLGFVILSTLVCALLCPAN
jgi:hypothetical protein